MLLQDAREIGVEKLGHAQNLFAHAIARSRLGSIRSPKNCQ